MQRDANSQSGWSARQHYEVAVLLHRQGKLDEAERHYRTVLQLQQGHPGALHNLALVLIHTRRLVEAAEAYQKIIAVAPGDAVAHAYLGQVLRSLGRNEEALAHLQRSLVLKPDQAEAHANLGNVLVALNRPQEALASYAKAQALKPRLAEPYNNMGNLLASLDRREEAVVQFEKALALRPDFVPAMNNLGNLLCELGRHEQAIAWLERALSIDPKDASAENNLGMALAALNRHDDAVKHYRKAIEELPDFPAALNNLGNSLDALVRPAEALEAFEKLLALDPDNAWAHFSAGNAQRILGRLDEARRFYERAVALAPGVPVFHRTLVEAKRFREDDPQLEVLEDLARKIASLSENERIELHFALAKAYDDIGRHAPAFEHLQSGNTLKRRMVTYDEAAQLGALRNIEETFTSELIAARRGLGNPSDRPIFIVGMPRSGTTLVEQILASYPRVFGGGELHHMLDLVSAGRAGAKFPFDFARLSGEQLSALGSLYVERIRPLAPLADHITDKLPANFSIAGLLHLALPGAHIVHVRRDPVDTCFSCYANLFSHGLEFTYDLGELGRHYRAYASLMEHWRRILPEGAMLEVQYEDLVADFKPQARRIVDYCGLEWDARCLSFYETKRAVRTASAAQVRRPLFSSSIGRWRPYKEQLRPLLDALECKPQKDGGSP
jgi:tetratricopeptide (TPR) repeat protein